MGKIEEIKSFTPKHRFFVGVDSDGTVFDTMEIKHKQCFIPTAIEIWQLKGLGEEFKAICENINLYSNLRGINRFAGLFMAFQKLHRRYPDAKDEWVSGYANLQEYLDRSSVVSMESLLAYHKSQGSHFLNQVLEWSRESDRIFDEITKNIQPYEHVKEAFAKLAEVADIMVVSSAADAGLERDFTNAGLMPYLSLLAGQGVGSKEKQLECGAKGKYNPENILMIGDAKGDKKAAFSIGASFYPVQVQKEAYSWKVFCDTYLEEFMQGIYQKNSQAKLIEEFETLLSETEE